MKDEPVAIVEAVKLLIVAVIGGGAKFDWWSITADQQEALIYIYVAASVVVTYFVRRFVTPNSKVPEVSINE